MGEVENAAPCLGAGIARDYVELSYSILLQNAVDYTINWTTGKSEEFAHGIVDSGDIHNLLLRDGRGL